MQYLCANTTYVNICLRFMSKFASFYELRHENIHIYLYSIICAIRHFAPTPLPLVQLSEVSMHYYYYYSAHKADNLTAICEPIV
jgi:hypothetical protein